MMKLIFIYSLILLSTNACADAQLSSGILQSLAGQSLKSSDTEVQAVFQAGLKELDPQISLTSDGTAYVSTGDIPAEWLRNSSVQVRPYLFFAKQNANAADLIKKVVLRQARNLNTDAYANAFRMDYSVWEEKFELDSLCYPILLAWTYWKTTGDKSLFTNEVKIGFERALSVMLAEQDHSKNSQYTHPDLSGNPVAVTGMIWTGFRPSDDPCKYNFLIPAEMMAVQALGALSEIESTIYLDSKNAETASKLRSDVANGIQKFAAVKTSSNGVIYAYEVDGRGNYLLMDDGNLPNLVGIPFFGFVDKIDPVYINTRKFALSSANQFYFSGSFAQGVGSPHTKLGMVWPLGLLAQAFTADNDLERANVLKMLLASDPGDHLLHESFDPNNPKVFTRPDFGWPNAMFIEYALTKLQGWPPLPVVGKYQAN